MTEEEARDWEASFRKAEFYLDEKEWDEYRQMFQKRFDQIDQIFKTSEEECKFLKKCDQQLGDDWSLIEDDRRFIRSSSAENNEARLLLDEIASQLEKLEVRFGFIHEYMLYRRVNSGEIK